jgi:hypothetical protein
MIRNKIPDVIEKPECAITDFEDKEIYFPFAAI